MAFAARVQPPSLLTATFTQFWEMKNIETLHKKVAASCHVADNLLLTYFSSSFWDSCPCGRKISTLQGDTGETKERAYTQLPSGFVGL